jgi:tetratricopeptide (TPR) repeat protein
VVLTWSLIALGRWADAENYALKGYAVRKDPRLTESLAEAAYFLGRNEAALRYFQSYLSFLPEGGRAGNAYYYIGEIYLRLAKWSHADIALSTAVFFSPSNARWWTRLGWAQEKAGDTERAKVAYTQALLLDKGIQDAINGLERLMPRDR